MNPLPRRDHHAVATIELPGEESARSAILPQLRPECPRCGRSAVPQGTLPLPDKPHAPDQLREPFAQRGGFTMEYTSAEKWIAGIRAKAIANARRALSPLLAQLVGICAIVAKEGSAGDLREILKSHLRLHSAEGFFYRDVLRNACTVPTRIMAPGSLDPSKVPKCASPWGRDQKLAALAGWTAMQ